MGKHKWRGSCVGARQHFSLQWWHLHPLSRGCVWFVYWQCSQWRGYAHVQLCVRSSRGQHPLLSTRWCPYGCKSSHPWSGISTMSSGGCGMWKWCCWLQSAKNNQVRIGFADANVFTYVPVFCTWHSASSEPKHWGSYFLCYGFISAFYSDHGSISHVGTSKPVENRVDRSALNADFFDNQGGIGANLIQSFPFNSAKPSVSGDPCTSSHCVVDAKKSMFPLRAGYMVPWSKAQFTSTNPLEREEVRISVPHFVLPYVSQSTVPTGLC